jgi:MoaA/NifB/PqqE/SkfB family radical SAM enzyme
MTAELPRLVVVWRVTERCNLSCAFCAYDRRLPFARRDADATQVRELGKVLGEYRKQSGRQVLVSWLGGEPLLWKPLTEISRVFKQQYALDLGVTTNGTALQSTATRRHVLENYAELTLSVDGFAPLHNQLRGSDRGFEQLTETVLALAEAKSRHKAGPLLRANVVLMRDNIADFPGLCRSLASLGIEEITFNQLGGNDRPEFFATHSLLLEHSELLQRQLPALRTELALQGVRLRGSESYVQRILASTRRERLPILDCAPGQTFLFITENGLISPCSFTSQQFGIPLASVRTPEDLSNIPVRFAELKRTRLNAACSDCHSTRVFHKFESQA